jgi:hypothetical protein
MKDAKYYLQRLSGIIWNGTIDRFELFRNSKMPNQYARVKNVAKGKDVIKDNKDQTYAFVDQFLEEEMKSSSIYETDEYVDYEYWSSKLNAHAKIA